MCTNILFWYRTDNYEFEVCLGSPIQVERWFNSTRDFYTRYIVTQEGYKYKLAATSGGLSAVVGLRACASVRAVVSVDVASSEGVCFLIHFTPEYLDGARVARLSGSGRM